MDSFVYDDQEVHCLCFDHTLRKNRQGLKPANILLNISKENSNFSRPAKSAESKYFQEVGSKAKKSLKRQKPKTPKRQNTAHQTPHHEASNFPFRFPMDSQRYISPAPLQWTQKMDPTPLKPFYSVPMVPNEQRLEKKYKTHVSPHNIVEFESMSFDPSQPSSSQQIPSFFEPTVSPQVSFASEQENVLNTFQFQPLNSTELKLKKKKSSDSPSKKSKGFWTSGRIFPKQIESVVDQNEGEDEMSQVLEWGWGNETKESKKEEENYIQTLNTMASNIKNSSIKNSLFGVSDSHCNKNHD